MTKRLWKWIGFKNRSSKKTALLEGDIPRHVAIIMDGNGRWARERGLPRVAGHHSGMKNVKNIAIVAHKIGVEYLTLYAFSTENWKRPKEEVDFLLRLPEEFFPQEIDELVSNNIRIRMMGEKSSLPEHTLRPVEEAIKRTENNTGMILNFAMNYGSRMEIVQAVQKLIKDVEAGRLTADMVTEQSCADRLFTREIPDPDLLIRTSGELRISNFMLWQLAYTELWFTDVKWPAFEEKHFLQAIREYQIRARRYGGLSSDVEEST